MKHACSLIAVLALGFSATALSDPHLTKTVTAKLPSEVEASINYYTVPANMAHIEKIKVGSFTPSRAVLTLSGATSSGSTAIPAGEYTIGAVRNASDWTLALHPKMSRKDQPDPSKLILLQSSFSNSEGTAHHTSFDVTPGHGSMEGKAVVIWHFGTMYLAGALK